MWAWGHRWVPLMTIKAHLDLQQCRRKDSCRRAITNEENELFDYLTGLTMLKININKYITELLED